MNVSQYSYCAVFDTVYKNMSCLYNFIQISDWTRISNISKRKSEDIWMMTISGFSKGFDRTNDDIEKRYSSKCGETILSSSNWMKNRGILNQS